MPTIGFHLLATEKHTHATHPWVLHDRDFQVKGIGGNFRQLFTLALFAEWLSYTAAAVALFVFRSRDRSVSHAVPLWKFPIAPGAFIMASAALLYYTFSSNLRYSVIGSLVILAGIPVFYAFAYRRRV